MILLISVNWQTACSEVHCCQVSFYNFTRNVIHLKSFIYNFLKLGVTTFTITVFAPSGFLGNLVGQKSQFSRNGNSIQVSEPLVEKQFLEA